MGIRKVGFCMIYGVGVDIERVSRVEKLLRHPKGAARVFGPRELAGLREHSRAESYAAAFCAKEAFAKALGTGLRGFGLWEVELLHGPLGEPFLSLSGAAKAAAARLGLCFFVSVSHTGDTACALVVAERETSGCL